MNFFTRLFKRGYSCQQVEAVLHWSPISKHQTPIRCHGSDHLPRNWPPTACLGTLPRSFHVNHLAFIEHVPGGR